MQPANLTDNVCAQASKTASAAGVVAGGCGCCSVQECASAGSGHGVVRGADNGIEAEGAVALAAALKANTTLQTLDLRSMWTARTRVFGGNGRPIPGTSRVRGRRGASGW